jgi:hypothetical protein
MLLVAWISLAGFGSERVLKTGGAGDSPVPVGDPPAFVAMITLQATAPESGQVVNSATDIANETDVAPADNQAAASVEITGTALMLRSPARAGTFFTFSFQSQSGASYTVEYNEDLRTTNWLFHHTMTGDGSLMPCLIPMTNATHRFFRVRMP